MKSYIVTILIFIIPVMVLGQDNNLEQKYKTGVELFDKKEYKKAYPLLMDAANGGHSDAQFLIGKMFQNGFGVKKESQKAFEWYTKSAEKGVAKAQNNLAIMYLNGEGCIRDSLKAISLFQMAAEQGFTYSQVTLGAHNELCGNYKDAMLWYQKAAEKEFVPAFEKIASLYDRGLGVEENKTEALIWYQKAADSGDGKAMARLGQMYEYGDGVKKDGTLALKWYQKSATTNNANGMLFLGVSYLKGEIVKMDYKEAAKWIEKAADENLAIAQSLLGAMYEQGNGVKTNIPKAVKLYKKSSDQGFADGQMHLAMMYLYGRGVDQDYAEAAWLFRKAAEQGHSTAQTFLGILYEEGKGVIQNKAEAAAWFAKALENDPNDNFAKEGLARTQAYLPIQDQQTASSSTSSENSKEEENDKVSIDVSGTGFIIDKRGYLATNYHVTEGARGIYVCLQKEGVWKSYNAILVKDDPINDLSIIRIEDADFEQFTSLPYNFTTEVEDVATDIYTLGYPRVNVMGTDIKYTAGAINSKTGIQGDPTHYQISAHTDHGNSGGPMFNTKGAIIGITDSGLDKAKYGDVNYAIKSSYLKSLVDALPVKLDMPHDTSIETLSRVEQIKILSKYTALILIDLP